VPKSIAISLVVIMLAIAFTSAYADTLNVGSGYVLLPDASTLGKGQLQVSASYVRSQGESELRHVGNIPMVCSGNGYNVRALAGLSNNLELGVGYLNIHKKAGDAHAWTTSAKMKLGQVAGLNVAVGASYRQWKSDMAVGVNCASCHGFGIKSQASVGPMAKSDIPYYDLQLPKVTSAYLALDKVWAKPDRFGWSWKMTGGLAYDHYTATRQEYHEDIFIDPNIPELAASSPVKFDFHDMLFSKNDFVRPFVGFEGTKEGLSVVGEYKWKETDDNLTYLGEQWSLALRKEVCPDWKISAGVTNFNVPYTRSHGAFFLDVTRSFGGK
jgi:hypothetical protein